MNTIKTKIGLVLLSGALALSMFQTGCTTTQQVTQFPDGSSVTNSVRAVDPVRTASAIRSIVPTAVVIAVTKEPSARDYIAKAQVAVCAVAHAGAFSPEELRLAVSATGIREIQTPEAQLAVSAVFGMYQAYYADVVAQKLNQAEWLVPILQAICDGLGTGLASSPAPVPKPHPQPVTNSTVIESVPVNSTIP